MIQAQWHTLTFQQSSACVRSLTDISISESLETDKTEDSEGKEPEQAVRLSLQTISLSYKVAMAAGVNPYNELTMLKGLLAGGIYAPFYIGGQSYGRCNFLLTKVEQSSSIIDGHGNMREAEFSLEFEEFAEEGGKRVDKGASVLYTPGIASNNGGSSVLTALRMTASQSERARYA